MKNSICVIYGYLLSDPVISDHTAGSKSAFFYVGDENNFDPQKQEAVMVLVSGKNAELAERCLKQGSKVYAGGTLEFTPHTVKNKETVNSVYLRAEKLLTGRSIPNGYI